MPEENAVINDQAPLIDQYIQSDAVDVSRTPDRRIIGVRFRPRALEEHGTRDRMTPVLMGQVQTPQGDELTSLPAANKKRHLDSVVEAIHDEFGDQANNATYVVTSNKTIYHGFPFVNQDFQFDAETAIEYQQFFQGAHSNVPAFVSPASSPNLSYKSSLNPVRGITTNER